KIEELGPQPGLLEQIEILGDENRRMVGGGNAVVEFKKLCRLLRTGNLRRERQRRCKEPRRKGPCSVHSLSPWNCPHGPGQWGCPLWALSADVLAASETATITSTFSGTSSRKSRQAVQYTSEGWLRATSGNRAVYSITSLARRRYCSGMLSP